MDELLRDPDRDGLDQAVVHEDQRVEEFVPGKGESEQRGGQDARQGQRNGDPHHRLDAGRAIHQGSLFELARYAFEEAHKHPGAEGNQERGVREDQRP